MSEKPTREWIIDACEYGALISWQYLTKLLHENGVYNTSVPVNHEEANSYEWINVPRHAFHIKHERDTTSWLHTSPMHIRTDNINKNLCKKIQQLINRIQFMQDKAKSFYQYKLKKSND